MPKKVVVECDPDEVLVKVLGFSRKEIAHENNKGEVCNYMNKNHVPLALIDEDPGSGQPEYLSKFKLVEERHGVKKLIKSSTNQMILVIMPRLEEWTIDQCTQSKIDPGLFHLPADARQLKKVINFKLDRFFALLKELLNHNNPGLNYLRRTMLNQKK